VRGDAGVHVGRQQQPGTLLEARDDRLKRGKQAEEIHFEVRLVRVFVAGNMCCSIQSAMGLGFFRLCG
jgi:hypothetical protein